MDQIENASISIKIPVTYNHVSAISYADDMSDTTIYGSGAKSKEKLRVRVNSRIAEGLRALDNGVSWAIGTADGHVLIVRWHCDSWGYAICGPGRSYASGVLGCGTYEETLAYARAHALDNLGGIAWQHSL